MLLKKHLTSMLTMSFFCRKQQFSCSSRVKKNYNKIAIVQVHINISSIVKLGNFLVQGSDGGRTFLSLFFGIYIKLGYKNSSTLTPCVSVQIAT